jgi:hypothetical protein
LNGKKDSSGNYDLNVEFADSENDLLEFRMSNQYLNNNSRITSLGTPLGPFKNEILHSFIYQ